MTPRTVPFSDFLAIMGGRAGVVTASLDREPASFGVASLARRWIRSEARARQLRRLADLEPHMLADIGVTRAEVLEELRKG
jgi:uncharacterized protein YjiS (DUF1127 family)